MNGNLVLIVTCFLYFGSGVNCGVVYNNEVLDEGKWHKMDWKITSGNIVQKLEIFWKKKVI